MNALTPRVGNVCFKFETIDDHPISAITHLEKMLAPRTILFKTCSVLIPFLFSDTNQLRQEARHLSDVFDLDGCFVQTHNGPLSEGRAVVAYPNVLEEWVGLLGID